MAPFNGSSPEMAALRKYCLEHGLYLYTHWHTVLIIPPLIITEEQLEEGFEVLDKALEITDASAEPYTWVARGEGNDAVDPGATR